MMRRNGVPASFIQSRLPHLLKSRLYGQTRMQIEQSEFWPAQKRKHFSAQVVHFLTPLRFDTL